MDKLDFYKSENYNQLIQRLDSLSADAQPKWGKMTVNQMLHHLVKAIGCGLGYYNLPDQSNLMTQNVVKFVVFNVLKGFPKNAATPKVFVSEEQYNFEAEKRQLKDILKKAYQTTSDNDWGSHTYFGKLNRREWGRLIMIHCDHHFKQFGS